MFRPWIELSTHAWTFIVILAADGSRRNPIPPDQSSWSTYGKLEDENRAQLRAILEEAAKASSVRIQQNQCARQKIGDYYASCMGEPAIEKLGAKPLQPELDRIAALRIKQGLAEFVSTTAFPPSLEGGGIALYIPLEPGLQRFQASNRRSGSRRSRLADDRDYYFKDDAKSGWICARPIKRMSPTCLSYLATVPPTRPPKQQLSCVSKPR